MASAASQVWTHRGEKLSAANCRDLSAHLSGLWNNADLFNNHGLLDLKKRYFWLTQEEIQVGLDVEGTEERFEAMVHKDSWIQQIRRLIAEFAMQKDELDRANKGKQPEATPDAVMESKAARATKANEGRTRRRQKSDRKSEHYGRRVGRLKLDDAVHQTKQNMEPEKAFEGWSEARIKAFKQIDTNPNAYFYRFNADGEKQDVGQWKPEEKELFLQRLKEMGPTQQWGIFSIAIPRRVGYQCSNFYRKLILEGEVTDPNYVIDKNGKLRYLFANRKVNEDGSVTRDGESSGSNKRSHDAGGDSEDASKNNGCSSRRPRSKGVKKRKPKKKRKITDIWASASDDDDDSDVEEYESVSKPIGRPIIRTRSGAYGDLDDAAFASLLPNYMDPVTQAPIKRPAISKYGHVMGYDTWMKCLNASGPDKGRCPITQQKLSKKDITLLTPENIDQYRPKMVMI